MVIWVVVVNSHLGNKPGDGRYLNLSPFLLLFQINKKKPKSLEKINTLSRKSSNDSISDEQNSLRGPRKIRLLTQQLHDEENAQCKKTEISEQQTRIRTQLFTTKTSCGLLTGYPGVFLTHQVNRMSLLLSALVYSYLSTYGRTHTLKNQDSKCSTKK